MSSAEIMEENSEVYSKSWSIALELHSPAFIVIQTLQAKRCLKPRSLIYLLSQSLLTAILQPVLGWPNKFVLA